MRERLIGLFDKQFCVGSIPTGGTKLWYGYFGLFV